MATPDIKEVQLAAFGEELTKLGSTWYSNVGQGLKRFGQRQLHSVSGYVPKGETIESIGAGAADARKALKNATGGAEKERARAALKAEVDAQNKGLTNIPGFAKSLVKDPKGTIGTALRQQWDGVSPLGKALTVGLPAAGLASDALSDDDGHKKERIGAGIASTAAGLVTGSMPFVGSMAAGMGAGYLGGRIGHVFDKAKKPINALRAGTSLQSHIQPPPNPEDAKGMGMPVEREMSPNAAGRPEVIG